MTAPLVGIVMGSDSDWEVMQHASQRLQRVRRAAREPGGVAPTGRRTCCSAMPRRRADGACAASSPARAAPRTCPACSPPRRRSRCSACRCHPSTSRGSTRCSRSCRCRRAFRWPRSPSATPARTTRGCTRWRSSRCSDAGLAERLDAFRARPDRARARAHAARGPRDPARRHRRDARRRAARPDVHAPGAHRWAIGSWCSIPIPLSPAGPVADRHLRAAYTTRRALDELADACAAVTTEFENVPAATLERLARTGLVRPRGRRRSRSPRTASPRRRFLAAPPASRRRAFRAGRSTEELDAAVVGRSDSPALLKTSRLGYDGKGQATVTDAPTARAAFERFGRVACMLEERLTLETELSVVARPRARTARVAAFPVGREPAPRRHPGDHGRPGPRARRAGARRPRRLRSPWPSGWSTSACSASSSSSPTAGALRQRDGAAPAQQRALHDGRLHGRPVRAAAPRPLRPAPGRAAAADARSR